MKRLFAFLTALLLSHATWAADIVVGNHVQYKGNTQLTIRSCGSTQASCSPTGQVVNDTEYGVALQGPSANNGLTWFEIRWDSGKQGWSSVDLGFTVTSVGSNSFHIGNRIQVATDTKEVRSCAAIKCTSLITQPIGSIGTVQGEATSAGGYWWYQVTWDSGQSGYSTSGNLVVANVAADNAPTFENAGVASTIARGLSGSFIGTARDDKSLASITGFATGPGTSSQRKQLFSVAPGTSSYSLALLSFDTTVLTGDIIGNYSVELVLRDSAGKESTKSFIVAVYEGSSPPPPPPPIVVTPPSPTPADISLVRIVSPIRLGERVRFTGIITDPVGIVNIRAFNLRTLPTPMTVNLNGETTVDISDPKFSYVAGPPYINVPGTYRIEFFVENARGGNSQKLPGFELVVNEVPPDITKPTLSGVALPAKSQFNKAVAFTGTATDDTALTSVTLGVTKPDGAAESRILANVSGIRSASISGFSYIPQQAGTFTFAVLATDTSGNTATQVLTTIVGPDNSGKIAELEAKKAELQATITAKQAAKTTNTAALSNLVVQQTTLTTAGSTVQTLMSTAQQQGPFSYTADSTLRPTEPIPSLPQCIDQTIAQESGGRVSACTTAPYGSDDYKRYPFTIYITYGFYSPGNNFPALIRGEYWNGRSSGCVDAICGGTLLHTAKYLVNNSTQLQRQLTYLQEQIRKSIDGDSLAGGEPTTWTPRDVISSKLEFATAWVDDTTEAFEQYGVDEGLDLDTVAQLGKLGAVIGVESIPIFWISATPSVIELIRAKSIVTEEPVSRWGSAFGVALSIVPELALAKRLTTVPTEAIPVVNKALTGAINIARIKRKSIHLSVKETGPMLERELGVPVSTDEYLKGVNSFEFPSKIKGRTAIRRSDIATLDGTVGVEQKQGYIGKTGRIVEEIEGDVWALCNQNKSKRRQVTWISYWSTNNPKSGRFVGIDEAVKLEFKRRLEACLDKGIPWDSKVNFRELNCSEFDCAAVAAVQ